MKIISAPVFKSSVLALSLSMLSLLCSALSANTQLQDITSAKHRSSDNIKRNVARHPIKTLQFFEVEPSMHVVEIWPGGGWYTEILAPYLKEHGQLYAAHFNPKSHVKFFVRSRENFENKLTQTPSAYENVIITTLDAPQKSSISNNTPVDRVLTFRNVHNWMKGGNAKETFNAFFNALKPGGILGVVEHRAPNTFSIEEMIKSGYVSEEHVKKLAAEAGFVFVEASEVNANPKDTKTHPKGVWTLPPSLRLGEKDKETYLAIGESDRMTLKFRKP